MLKGAVFLLLPAVLGAAELTVDHVTVAGKNLKSLQARLAGVGIASEYGGPHVNHVTEMALVSFPDGSYLELIALQPKADAQAAAKHYWGKWMLGNAGPCAWAARGEDIPAEVQRLRAAGVAVNEPMHSGRERPDGAQLEWETARVGKEPNGTFFPFLIHDFTPREARVFPKGKPTNEDFSGVKNVVIAVHNLGAAVGRYEKAYGLEARVEQTDEDFGARMVWLRGTPVVLAAPRNAQSWLAGHLREFGEGPCAFILAGRNGKRYKTGPKSNWFGTDVAWFDATKLGWHLGVE